MLCTIGNHVMPRMAGCGKEKAKEGRGKGKAGVWASREEGQRGRGKTRAVAKGVKTAVNALMAVANSVKLGGIILEGD